MEEESFIAVEHLHVALGNVPVIKDLSFAVKAGQTLAIIGEGGSGKSLTALALMGLLPKAVNWSGSIHLADVIVTPATPKTAWQHIRGKAVSMVFQAGTATLNPLLQVGAQLAEAIKVNTAISAHAAKEAAMEWLRKVQFAKPEKCFHKYPHQLTDSEQRRVMIAMAMSVNPALLIADEPTAGLDVTIQAELIQLMRTLQAERAMAIIFITHNLSLAAAMADDVLVMQAGEAVEYGAANELYAHPQHPYTKSLLAGRAGLAAEPPFSEIQHTGNATAAEIPKQPSSNPLLKVRNLRVWYPSATDWLGTPTRFTRAVEDLSFDLYHGEVLGLVGEAGSGKSSLARAITGLQSAESGQMVLEGKDLVHANAGDWRRIRRDVQMIAPDPRFAFDPRQTIAAALTEPLLAHRIVPRKEAQQEILRLLELALLTADILERYPQQLNRELLQRINIARAIALRPRLIICDEILTGIDPIAQAQILNLLKELQATLSLSCLFISHDLDAVSYVADRVLVMQAGKIVERGGADVLKHPKEPYTKKLVAAMP